MKKGSCRTFGKTCIRSDRQSSRRLVKTVFQGSFGLALVLILTQVSLPALAQFPSDTFPTSSGDLKITLVKHATLMFQIGNTVIHIDPWSALADYKALPKADLILITHNHHDHMDAEAVAAISKEDTVLVGTENVVLVMGKGQVLNHGQQKTVAGIGIEAIPAYNLEENWPDGPMYHFKGDGNGYLLTVGGKRIYIAGDTENTPEMKALKNIDVAFLPANRPYTMTAEMILDAVRAIKPKIFYPYHFHYAESQLPEVIKLMKQVPEVELRVRNPR